MAVLVGRGVGLEPDSAEAAGCSDGAGVIAAALPVVGRRSHRRLMPGAEGRRANRRPDGAQPEGEMFTCARSNDTGIRTKPRRGVAVAAAAAAASAAAGLGGVESPRPRARGTRARRVARGLRSRDKLLIETTRPTMTSACMTRSTTRAGPSSVSTARRSPAAHGEPEGQLRDLTMVGSSSSRGSPRPRSSRSRIWRRSPEGMYGVRGAELRRQAADGPRDVHARRAGGSEGQPRRRTARWSKPMTLVVRGDDVTQTVAAIR